ncbi:MAG: phospholipid carrier-dependent glycosyltransferase [Bacteroidota bacterium]
MQRRIRDKKRNCSRPPGRLRIYFEGKEQHLLAILLIVVSCTAGIVLYHIDKHSFLYFGDAASHIVKARQFFDSQRPGFHNIGTVWLPLPHLILLPLVAIDALFYSGIAGLLVGIPCLVGTGILLFLIVRRITGSLPIAFLSGCLFGLNPNMVYMALTPMNEPIFIFLVTLGGYALLRWLLNDGKNWLWACAAAVALASLCRYEAWFLVPFVSLVSGLKGIFLWQRAERGAALRLLTIAGICWVGIAFWVCWNYVEYGDPLKFARWTYSIATGAAQGNMRQPPLDALLIFGRALLVIFGPVVLLTASGAFVRSQRTTSNRIHPVLVLLFLGLPSVFALVAILAGFVQVDQWSWNWRYVLTAILFLSVAGGIGLSEFCRRVGSTFARGVVVAGLIAMPLVQIAIPAVGVATFNDAQRSVSDGTRFAIALGEQLHGIYTEGSIALLTGYSQGQRIRISSGLPLKQFHIIYNSVEEDILGSPPDSERYIVIGKDRTPESEQFVNNWLSRRDELLHYYNICFDNGHYVLMERKPGSTSPGIQRSGTLP